MADAIETADMKLVETIDDNPRQVSYLFHMIGHEDWFAVETIDKRDGERRFEFKRRERTKSGEYGYTSIGMPTVRLFKGTLRRDSDFRRAEMSGPSWDCRDSAEAENFIDLVKLANKVREAYELIRVNS